MQRPVIQLSALLLVAACRPASAPVVVDAEQPDPRDVTRAGLAPPMYPAGSGGPRIAITRNAYGAYAYAPKAPQLGDTLADFELPIAGGGTYALHEARAKGPVVLVFYRGFW